MKRKVFIVDDEKEKITDMFKFVVEETLGHDVEVAYSGEEGLEKLKNYTPDLIVTDLKMPGMTGTEMIKQYIEENKLKKLPFAVLVYTGSFSKDISHKKITQDILNVLTENDTVYGFLTKSSDTEKPLNTINDLLDKRDHIFYNKNDETLAKFVEGGIEHEEYNLSNAEGLQKSGRKIYEEKERSIDNEINKILAEAKDSENVNDALEKIGELQENRKKIQKEISSINEALDRIDEEGNSYKETRKSYSDFMKNQHSGPFSVKNVIDKSIDYLLLVKTKSDIDQNITDDFEIKGDYKAVVGAVMNVLMNAWQSRIHHTMSAEITISTESDNEYNILSISDKGKGMSEETQKRLFEPTYTGREKKGGHGLGMYIVQTVMESVGGKVDFESELEKGSTFRLYFPKQNQEN